MSDKSKPMEQEQEPQTKQVNDDDTATPPTSDSTPTTETSTADIEGNNSFSSFHLFFWKLFFCCHAIVVDKLLQDERLKVEQERLMKKYGRNMSKEMIRRKLQKKVSHSCDWLCVCVILCDQVSMVVMSERLPSDFKHLAISPTLKNWDFSFIIFRKLWNSPKQNEKLLRLNAIGLIKQRRVEWWLIVFLLLFAF